MLIRLTRAAKRLAAAVIVAVYACGLIMPSAAIAFGADDHAPHCLTDEQLGLPHLHDHGDRAGSPIHVHRDIAMRRHEDVAGRRDAGASHRPAKSDGNDDPGACCGLFGVTAMAVDPELNLGADTRFSSVFAISIEELSGRDPDRIHRPPISLLPL